ncbi:nucleoside-diphosphate kinase [Allofustis seminis]|uniref:nucleoside-diphosphate kinase n=1 Tax=Allofustis seminis TaxID=166939 RepID=UPI000363705C|nr:nucleoside-diphosphate kinase [Allofustis seminis]
MEKTFVIIKPDGVKRHLIGQILHEYERNGLEIADMKMIHADVDTVKAHYAEHVEKPFFQELVDYLTSGPIVILVLQGEDAVARVRALNGATNPEEAGVNTIRALYAVSLSENTVHASDSLESAEREIGIWFN